MYYRAGGHFHPDKVPNTRRRINSVKLDLIIGVDANFSNVSHVSLVGSRSEASLRVKATSATFIADLVRDEVDGPAVCFRV